MRVMSHIYCRGQANAVGEGVAGDKGVRSANGGQVLASIIRAPQSINRDEYIGVWCTNTGESLTNRIREVSA